MVLPSPLRLAKNRLKLISPGIATLINKIRIMMIPITERIALCSAFFSCAFVNLFAIPVLLHVFVKESSEPMVRLELTTCSLRKSYSTN